jgi:glucose/arabinose dehydrogenase
LFFILGHLFARAAAIESGTLTGWGWDGVLPQAQAGLTNVVALTAGPYHGMALLRDGTVVTWGYYTSGDWVAHPDLSNIVGIAAGYSHDVAVKRNRRVIEWGAIDPLAMLRAVRNVATVSAGNGFSMALRRNGTVVVWGDGSYGQTNTPAKLRRIEKIAAGGEHCLALRKDGTVVAWGRNDFGQAEVPAGLSSVVAIAAGPSNSLAATRDGIVWEWGARIGPAVTNVLAEVTELTAGLYYNVALKRDRTVMAWGWESGAPPAGLTNVFAISSGTAATIAITKAPIFRGQPEDRIVLAGETALFYAQAQGNGPISYQWLLNGEPIPGATNVDLEVSSATPMNAGLYTLQASNAFGSSISSPALLRVAPFWIHYFQQDVHYATIGGQAQFFISASGPGITYHWLANGTPIPGATDRLLVLTNVMHSDAGYYHVVVSNAYGSSNFYAGPLRIAPTWNVDDVSILKTPGGSNALTFNVSIVGGPFSEWLEVGYQTISDSAQAGVDYVAASGVLRFPPLVTNQTVTVEVLNNGSIEPKRMFLGLHMAHNAPPYDGFRQHRGSGWILIEEFVPQISVAPRAETEGDVRTTFQWPIVLSGPCVRPITVHFSTADATAHAGTDYESRSGQLVFPAGSVTQQVDITILGNLLRETNRVFALNLFAPSNAVLVTTQTTFTIIDDDQLILPPSFKAELVIGNIGQPTAMEIASDGRIFVASQNGFIYVVKNGAVLPTPFARVTTETFDGAEAGLLGLALDPGFETNHFVYVYYTSVHPILRNRISRFTADGDVAGSEEVIFEVDPIPEAYRHNGGGLHFGRDGKLYVGVGDNATSTNAQSLGNLLGKVLRINSDGSIPTDNPFYNTAQGANRAIWAYGLRNPFSFAFQPGTGRMFINDVGEETWEEINEGRAGANYGWPQAEGFSLNPLWDNPVAQYGHAPSTNAYGCAIVGAGFYNPSQAGFPSEYLGDYFFADFCGGWIRRLTSDNVIKNFAKESGYVANIHVGADGALYLLGGYHQRLWGYVCRITYAE